MKHFIFELDKSKKIIDGKPHWEHSLTMHMKKCEAIQILRLIASQLSDFDDDIIIIPFVGYLTEEDK